MKKTARNITLIAILIPVAVAVYMFKPWLWGFGGAGLPMAEIENLDSLQTLFNHDTGKPRLVLILSPT